MNNRKLSEEAGLDQDVYTWNQIQLERFAELVRQDEREACAKLCDLVAKEADDTDGLATYIGKVIRARGDMSTKWQNVYTSEECVQETDKPMHDLRKAAEMALDVLLNEYALGTERNPSPYDTIKALETALAQPEQEKGSTLRDADPRLLLGRSNNFTKETENRLCDIERRLAAIETQPTPPSKPWVSLSDEEIEAAIGNADYIYLRTCEDTQYEVFLTRAIEAKLRERNT